MTAEPAVHAIFVKERNQHAQRPSRLEVKLLLVAEFTNRTSMRTAGMRGMSATKRKIYSI